MAGLVLKDIRKSYGAVNVLHGIDLEIAEGEFVVFVGPSGCGTSTLLRMIAGLEDISAGDLTIGGQRVNDVPPSRRGIASLPVKTMTSPDKGPPSLRNYALRRLFEGLRARKRRRR